MRHLYKPKTLGVAGLMVTVAMLAIGASAAFAAGPAWITTSGKITSEQTLESHGTKFVLKSAVGNIECANESDTGALRPTEPGTDADSVTFTECFREGSSKACKVASEGQTVETTIGPVELFTELMYPEGIVPNTKEALEAFAPAEGRANVFVILVTKGTDCGLLPSKFTVEA